MNLDEPDLFVEGDMLVLPIYPQYPMYPYSGYPLEEAPQNNGKQIG